MKNIPFNKNSILLAPMAGITDSGFRRICKEHGADCTYSEMISSKGLFYNDEKTRQLMSYSTHEEPIILQIFGSDKECIKYAVNYINRNFTPAAIDINMGCPAPKIFSNGDGCALMGTPEKAYDIIKAAKEVSDFPVSVKFRSGISSRNINAVEFAKICESAGADFITVHGRTRDQFYSGNSDMDIIKRVVENVSIPVIANGDISDYASAHKALMHTNAYAVMVGRAALGNPAVFEQIKSGCCDADSTQTNHYIFEIADRHLQYVIEDKGEFQAVKEFRKHLLYYLKGIKNASVLKQLSCKAISYNDCMKIFDIASKNI